MFLRNLSYLFVSLLFIKQYIIEIQNDILFSILTNPDI